MWQCFDIAQVTIHPKLNFPPITKLFSTFCQTNAAMKNNAYYFLDFLCKYFQNVKISIIKFLKYCSERIAKTRSYYASSYQNVCHINV